MSPVPAGKRPFPTLSPQSLYRCKDPYPAAFLRCSCPFLPEGLRSHSCSERFDTPIIRRYATSTTGDISGLQSFHNVQAPILVRPSGCTHHWTSKCPGRPGRLHHASPGWLPIPRCGITTCLNRAIGTAGLSPAGLRPCRLLRPPKFRCSPWDDPLRSVRLRSGQALRPRHVVTDSPNSACHDTGFRAKHPLAHLQTVNFGAYCLHLRCG